MDNSLNKGNDVIEIDLVEIFFVIWHNIVLIMALGLLCALVGFSISRFVIAPTYESTTKIYILNKSDTTTVSYSDVQMGTQLTKDYAQLITSRYVLEEVIQELGLSKDYNEFLGQITVTTPTDTRVVAITVVDTDPVMAMNMANAVRESASEHIQNVMDIDAVNVVETANMPTGKAGPSCMKWTAIAALLGMFLVIAIVLVRYLVDDTIKTSEDVKQFLELSTLALIPLDEEEESVGRKKKKHSRKEAEEI